MDPILRFIVSGGILMSAIALGCFKWSNYLILREYNLALRLCPSLLLIVAAFVIPWALFMSYVDVEILQPDEAPGLLGPSVAIPFLLWPFGAMLLLAYFIAACFRRGAARDD